MANITLNTFALQMVKEFAGSNAISDLDLVAQVERYANDVIKHIRNFSEWPWLYTSETMNTVASQAGYVISTGSMDITGMRLAGGYDTPLKRIGAEQLSDQGVDLETTGQPELYILTGYTVSSQGAAFNLWPVPNAIYPLIIYETVRATDVASSSNIPLPEDFMAVLRDGMRHYMARDEGDLQGAQAAIVIFDAGLKRLRQRYINPAQEQYYNDIPSGNKPRFPGFTSKYPI